MLVLGRAGPVFGQCHYCAPAGRLCGVSRGRRVVGGGRARAQDLPWTALIVYKEPEAGRVKRCGGTLINDRYVLTSAACVDEASNIDVYLGKVRPAQHRGHSGNVFRSGGSQQSSRETGPERVEDEDHFPADHPSQVQS